MIVGNKADLRGLSKVSAADAEDYARSIGGFHALASAKSGYFLWNTMAD